MGNDPRDGPVEGKIRDTRGTLYTVKYSPSDLPSSLQGSREEVEFVPLTVEELADVFEAPAAPPAKHLVLPVVHCCSLAESCNR